MIRALILTLVLAAPAMAQTVVPLRPIRADTRIGPGDIGLTEQVVPGAISRPEDAIGREARVTLYPNRPIAPGDLADPAVVERNQVVLMNYTIGGLMISTEGRVLSRARPGERLQVMNLSSRTTVWGVVSETGIVEVGQ